MKLKPIVERIIMDESGLSRIWKHIDEHDCAMISGWRKELINCRIGDSSGKKLVYDEKNQRNLDLRAALLKLRYGVTNVQGAFIENFGSPQASEVNENSFFVVNENSDPKFISNMSKFGEYYCQDAILIKPIGENAYLIGTNNYTDPGYGQKVAVGNFRGGVENMFMTKIHGRPFVFEKWDDAQIMSKYLMEKESEEVLKFIKES